tara:strand:- start:24 stop:1811 length:1788 start_codon:yes stop_codon:yes gene_type:complete
MKYPKEYLDEIKLRLRVSQVVSKSVKLKRRGKEFIGLSPFSNEKTPSFTVSDEKGFYHCFSSGEHGNIFDFLMKTKNYKFGDAVRALASEAGMEPYRFTKQDEAKENRWSIYKKILDKYTNLCHEIFNKKKYQEVNEYLSKRKITQKEIELFKIGYSPIDNNFKDTLLKEFNEEQIKTSGIYYFDERKKVFVDRFKGRIIFPVINLSGSIFALGGRTISKSTFAKYINSPETEFYKKGNNLYNVNLAKESRNKREEVFIVEGYIDVITLYKNGIQNVVANLGTAMTERQLNLIWKFFKNPIICLDGDISGQKAAVRAAERLFPLMKPDFNIHFLTLPNNLDPDSYINNEGKESFLKLSEKKIAIHDFIWNSYYQEIDKNNPHSLSIFEKKIRNICGQVGDKILAKYFLSNFNERILELTSTLKYKNNSFLKFRKMDNPLKQTKDFYNEKNKFEERELKEYSIIFIVMNNLDIFRKHIELFSEVIFSNSILGDLKKIIMDYLISEKFFDLNKISKKDFDASFHKVIDNINSYAPVKIIMENKSEDEILIIFNEIISEINKIELKRKIESLEDKVSANLDEKLYSELLSLRNQLKSG